MRGYFLRLDEAPPESQKTLSSWRVNLQKQISPLCTPGNINLTVVWLVWLRMTFICFCKWTLKAEKCSLSWLVNWSGWVKSAQRPVMKTITFYFVSVDFVKAKVVVLGKQHSPGIKSGHLHGPFFICRLLFLFYTQNWPDLTRFDSACQPSAAGLCISNRTVLSEDEFNKAQVEWL